MDKVYIGDRLQEFNPGLECEPISCIVLSNASSRKSEDVDTDRTVYITDSGSCYHSIPYCGSGTYYPSTLENAREKGLTPCQNCGGDKFVAGDNTGYIIEAEMDGATQEIAEYILKKLKGYVYRPFSGSAALLDMAAELGDGISVGGIYSVLVSADITLDMACAANISAPSEIEDEYPYIPKSDRELKRLNDKVDELEDDVDELQDDVDDLQDEVDELKEKIAGLGTGIGGHCKHPRTKEMDFSSWFSGKFVEIVDDPEETRVEYAVQFDRLNRPDKIITLFDEHETLIKW